MHHQRTQVCTGSTFLYTSMGSTSSQHAGAKGPLPPPIFLKPDIIVRGLDLQGATRPQCTLVCPLTIRTLVRAHKFLFPAGPPGASQVEVVVSCGLYERLEVRIRKTHTDLSQLPHADNVQSNSAKKKIHWGSSYVTASDTQSLAFSRRLIRLVFTPNYGWY